MDVVYSEEYKAKVRALVGANPEKTFKELSVALPDHPSIATLHRWCKGRGLRRTKAYPKEFRAKVELFIMHNLFATQQEIADKFNISKNAVSRWERALDLGRNSFIRRCNTTDRRGYGENFKQSAIDKMRNTPTLTYKELSYSLGISASLLNKWCRDAGIKKTKGYKPEFKAAAVEAAEDNPYMSYRKLAQQLGIYELTLFKWCKAAGTNRRTTNAYEDSFKQKVVKAFVDNPHLDYKQVADKFGISSMAAYTWWNNLASTKDIEDRDNKSMVRPYLNHNQIVGSINTRCFVCIYREGATMGKPYCLQLKNYLASKDRDTHPIEEAKKKFRPNNKCLDFVSVN